jgi:hypothetical protein
MPDMWSPLTKRELLFAKNAVLFDSRSDFYKTPPVTFVFIAKTNLI